MKRHSFSALLLAALLTASAAAARTIGVGSCSSPADVLRSAYYMCVTGRDRAVRPESRLELKAQLQRHFDVVLAQLVANSDHSLDVALKRLQQSRGESWSDDERADWRQMLSQRRALNICRLRLYQRRGLFPLNEHTTERAVPIFVDNHGTACAVGHLMRESGWSHAVMAIRYANNFVYVTDVRDGPLVDWVLVSGLTQEEAALIQPTYFPQYSPPPFDAGLDELMHGGSITKDGLRFDNFHFVAGEIAESDTFPPSPPATSQIDPAGHGVAFREGAFQGFTPAFNNWLWVGARSWESWIYSQENPWSVLYSYDVTTVDPEDRLVAASLKSSIANFNFGPPVLQSSIYRGGATEVPALADLELNSTIWGAGLHWLVDEDSASFAPEQKLTIITAVKLEVREMFTSIVHSFQVVPEPATAFSVALGCALTLIHGRRRPASL